MRRFTEIAAPAGTATTFTDTGLTASATSYGYRVRATDAAGNLGGLFRRRRGNDPAARHGAPTAPGTSSRRQSPARGLTFLGRGDRQRRGRGYGWSAARASDARKFTKLGTTIIGNQLQRTSLGVEHDATTTSSGHRTRPAISAPTRT